MSHDFSAQLGPNHGWSHSHVPSTHRPWPPQSAGHRREEQSAPKKPGRQRQTPVAASQWPLFEQPLGQVYRLQSRPVKVGSQRQLPSTQVPCDEQFDGQARSAHEDPVKPG